MKKFLVLIFFVFLLFVVYGGAGYWIGGLAHRQHDILIAQINRSDYIQASNRSYERGIFSSTAVTDFAVSRPDGGDRVKFSVVSSIFHGPLVFLRNRHLDRDFHPALAVIRTRPAGDCPCDLKKLLEEAPELQSSEALTVISFDGSGEAYVDVPAFKRVLTDKEKGKFETQWAGFSAKSKFDAQLGEITGSYEAPSLQIEQQEEMLRIKNFHGDFNSHPGIKGVSVGSFSLGIDSVESSEKGEESFSMISLGVQGESGVSGESVFGSLRVNLDKLDGGGLVLGPLTVELEARKLDADILARFERIAPELGKKAAGGGGNADLAMQLFMKEILAGLITKSPEFEVKQLKIRTDRGDLSGKASLAFSDAGKVLGGNILGVLAGIEASADLSVSEALFFFVVENALREGSGPDSVIGAKRSAGEVAKGLLAEKIMVRENGAFKSSATYKRGRLSVNGRKLDFSSLLESLTSE